MAVTLALGIGSVKVNTTVTVFPMKITNNGSSAVANVRVAFKGRYSGGEPIRGSDSLQDLGLGRTQSVPVSTISFDGTIRLTDPDSGDLAYVSTVEYQIDSDLGQSRGTLSIR